MFKKKKYQRSGWFTGLLESEELLKKGYTFNSVYDEPLWFTKIDEDGIKEQITIGYSLSGRKDGAIDYVEYKQSVLDKLNE